LSGLTLCYHAVDGTAAHRLAIAPPALERQVASVLRRGYRGGTAADVLGGSRVLHVTFDDAYGSVRRALPILERLGVPVTVFACTSFAGDGRPLAIPELASAVAAEPEVFRTMRWDDLRELVERGVEVGSHTCTHPHLPDLDDADLRRELVESREQLEDELGRPCRYVAYPFGEADARVAAAAAAAGYDAAFALGPLRAGSRFMVPRTDLYPADGLVRTAVKTTPLWFGAAAAAAVIRGARWRARLGSRGLPASA
jgi:peptidoglycan/xylan/chitin deacetylase (PgdA/CDA1 family)